MKTYWDSEGTAPRILDLGTRRRSVLSFTPRPLHSQGKSPWYSLDRRLDGPQSRSGRSAEEKNSHSPPGIEPQNHDRPARNPALYGLSFHGSYGNHHCFYNTSKIKTRNVKFFLKFAVISVPYSLALLLVTINL
jgi:hypothetical protein